MADRSITISLNANVTGFTSGMRTAQQATQSLSSRTAAFARDNEEHLDRVGKAGMVMGGSILAGIGLAVKSFMEFDSAMSEVKASTHETAANMDLLRDAAVNAGADTAFSAKEAANAIDELAKAGVSTKDILGGGLAGALSLAAAGSLDVAKAAEISATALTQFKLHGADIPHIADLLAAGAGKAQGSVEDIGGALQQSGLVASQFGMSIEDTTGTLASFASAGLIGSDAGTSLKTMLLKLAAPSKEASGMMADLGIAAYDSGGKFVGVTNLAGQLKDRLGGLTQAQRDSTLATIFGTDAIRGANVLYEQGAAGITGWIDKVNESGYAAATASIKQDNLAGDLEKLGGSFDSVLIKGGGGAAEALRGLVQGLEDMVDTVGRIPAPVLNAGVAIAGITGGVLLLGGGLMTLAPKLAAFKASQAALAVSAPRLSGAITGIGKAAGVAAVAMVALVAANAAFGKHDTAPKIEETTQAIMKLSGAAKSGDATGLDSLFKNWDATILKGAPNDVNNLADAVKRLANKDGWDSFNQGAGELLSMVGGGSAIGQVEERIKSLGESMGQLTKNGGAEAAAVSFKELTKQFEANGKGAKEALDAVPGYKDALLGLANAAHVAVSDGELVAWAGGDVPAAMALATGATETFKTATGAVVPITPEVSKALEDIGLSAQGAVVDLVAFTDALINAGLMQLSARDAARGFQAAIDAVGASITANGTTLDINTEKGRANQAALDGIASAGFKVVQANAANGASQATLQGNLNATYNKLVAGAGQFGITGQAAINLARSILKVPPGVDIKSWMSDAAKRMAEQTAGAMNAIDGKTVNTYVNHHETTIQDVIRKFSNDPSAPPVGTGTVLRKKAVGGAIIGPGSGTSDDIPALLSNGEHVLTAAEVDRMGGQAAVYRFRQMLDAGQLPKFATGGHVGESANARANRLYRERVAAAKKRAAELRKSAQYRGEQIAGLQLDDSRGQSYRTVNDSLSSAYSFSDRLRSVAKSGNVPSQKWVLLDKANSSDGALRRLYSQSEKLGKSLESAKKRMEDLASVRASVASKLSGEFSIGEAAKRGFVYGKDSMKSIQGSASRFLAKVQGFAGKLKALQKKGYSGAIVQEIADMGVADGSLAADALLQAKPGEVASLNSTYKAIGTASTLAGTYVTDSMFKGGVNAATGLVKGLQSQQGAIDKQMERIGLGMEDALKRALGLPVPKRKAVGGRVYGPGTTTSDSIPHLLSKDEYVIKASAAKRIGYDELDRMNRGQMKPAITYRPVATTGTGGGSRDVHVHLDAKAGLAHEYASDMARQTTVRLKDALHSIDIR